MIDHQIWRLRGQHRDLERLIRREQGRPEPDAALIQTLKRRKLRIKDELFLAEAGLTTAAISPSYG